MRLAMRLGCLLVAPVCAVLQDALQPTNGGLANHTLSLLEARELRDMPVPQACHSLATALVGQWTPPWEHWEPMTCYMPKLPTKKEALSRLAGKRFSFVGDSTMEKLFHAFLGMLGCEAPIEGQGVFPEAYDITSELSSNHTLHPSSNPQISCNGVIVDWLHVYYMKSRPTHYANLMAESHMNNLTMIENAINYLANQTELPNAVFMNVGLYQFICDVPRANVTTPSCNESSPATYAQDLDWLGQNVLPPLSNRKAKLFWLETTAVKSNIATDHWRDLVSLEGVNRFNLIASEILPRYNITIANVNSMSRKYPQPHHEDGIHLNALFYNAVLRAFMCDDNFYPPLLMVKMNITNTTENTSDVRDSTNTANSDVANNANAAPIQNYADQPTFKLEPAVRTDSSDLGSK